MSTASALPAQAPAPTVSSSAAAEPSAVVPASVDGNVVTGGEFEFASEVVARGSPLEPSRLLMPSLSTGAAMAFVAVDDEMC